MFWIICIKYRYAVSLETSGNYKQNKKIIITSYTYVFLILLQPGKIKHEINNIPVFY